MDPETGTNLVDSYINASEQMIKDSDETQEGTGSEEGKTPDSATHETLMSNTAYGVESRQNNTSNCGASTLTDANSTYRLDRKEYEGCVQYTKDPESHVNSRNTQSTNSPSPFNSGSHQLGQPDLHAHIEDWIRQLPRLSNIPKLQVVVSGGGFAGAYGAGALWALQHLHNHKMVEITQWSGTSVGSVMVVMFCCQIPFSYWNRFYQEFDHAHKEGSFSILQVIQQGLEDLLPMDAHVRCSGRIWIRVLEWCERTWGWIPKIYSHFPSRAFLIQTVCASCAIPFVGTRSFSPHYHVPERDGFTSWKACDGLSLYAFDQHEILDGGGVLVIRHAHVPYDLRHLVVPNDPYIGLLVQRGLMDFCQIWKNLQTGDQPCMDAPIVYIPPTFPIRQLLDSTHGWRQGWIVRILRQFPWPLIILQTTFILVLWIRMRWYKRKARVVGQAG